MDGELEYSNEPINRTRDLVDNSRLDIAALIWMVCLSVIVAAGIQQALSQHFPGQIGESENWIKVASLARVGGLTIAIAVPIGLVVAAAVPTRPARYAAALGAALGVWLAVSAGCGIAYVLWAPGSQAFSLGGDTTWVTVLMELAELVVGLLVAAAAFRVVSYVCSFENVEGEPTVS